MDTALVKHLQAEQAEAALLREAIEHLGPEVNILGADSQLHEVDLERLPTAAARARQILLAYEESTVAEECGRCDGSGCPACPNAAELFEER